MKHTGILFTLLILFVTFSACKDDVTRSNVPSLKFGVELHTQQVFKDQYSGKNIDLHIIGSILTLNKTDSRFPHSRLGYQGLLIVHSLFDEGSYQCFDRTCPVDLQQTLPPNSTYEVICPKCHEAYNAYTGFPKNGISDQPLRSYRTATNGERLIIAN